MKNTMIALCLAALAAGCASRKGEPARFIQIHKDGTPLCPGPLGNKQSGVPWVMQDERCGKEYTWSYAKTNWVPSGMLR